MIIYAADDEQLALELLSDAISEAIPGENPICFDESEKLLEAAREKIPDMVFLDIKMPETNGIETAKRLNEISAGIKIIFVTGFTDYTKEAFDVYAFGYLMKPCSAKHIRSLVEKIQNPLVNSKDIMLKTFGNFDIFHKGNPINFRSPKSKELLAYLVDREGGFVTRKEAASALFEDDYSRSIQVQLTQFALRLSEDLESAGVHNFFFSDSGYYLDISLAECDFTEYLKGNPKYGFLGEYMEQYSWGEFRKSEFEKRKKN